MIQERNWTSFAGDPFVPLASVCTRTLKTIGARRGKTGSELRIPGDGDQRFRTLPSALIACYSLFKGGCRRSPERGK